MALPGLGKTPNATQQHASNSPRSAFKQLKEAIGVGDVEQAKIAYATVKQHAPSGPQSKDAASTPFEAVGRALDDGDATKAKEAFRSLENLLRSLQETRPPAPSSGHDAAGDEATAAGKTKRLDIVA